MSLKEYLFIFTILYLQCEARKKNFSLDQVKGSWLISNASQNAIILLGDCPSLEIAPAPKKSHENSTGTILLKIHKMTYTVTIVSMDDSTYQIYNSDLLPLGNLSILTAEPNKFLIIEVKREEDAYFAVLTNEKKTSEKINKKISKFWNSTDSTKNVALVPVKQENCQTTEGQEKHLETNNALHITSITVEDTYVADSSLEYESGGKTKGVPSQQPELSSETTPVIRPHITIKLGGNTPSTTAIGTSSVPLSSTETQFLYPKENHSSVKIKPSDSTVILPNLIIVLVNLILLII